jgi:hypothetical protein
LNICSRCFGTAAREGLRTSVADALADMISLAATPKTESSTTSRPSDRQRVQIGSIRSRMTSAFSWKIVKSLIDPASIKRLATQRENEAYAGRCWGQRNLQTVERGKQAAFDQRGEWVRAAP